jgi:hypothetical protein
MNPERVLRVHSPSRHQIIVELTNDCSFILPVDKAQGLAGISNKDLTDVKVLGKGFGLHWGKLDADLNIPSLIVGLFGSKVWMQELARLGDASTSPAKAAAARSNGQWGGNTQKVSVTEKYLCPVLK